MKVLYENFRWKDTDEIQMMLVENGIVIDRSPTIKTDLVGIEVVDKSNWRLFPAYIDNHCHILPTGLDLAKLNLSEASSHPQVLDLLFERHHSQPEGWLLAVHYDQNRYGGRDLTVDDLDKISADRPILLRHSSGHAGVANSRALALADIPSNVTDELGGSFLRDAAGRLNGVLLESAFERVGRATPKPTEAQMTQAILDATNSMAALNISCASDMQTGWFDLIDELNAYRAAAEKGAKIATRLYLQWGRVYGPKAPSKDKLRELIDGLDQTNCRVQGIKLFADGAIGAGTAAIYGSYADGFETGETSGTLTYRPEVLKTRIKRAAEDGWQVSVHAIGDYASDLVMSAYEETETPALHRIEHAMLLDDSQIERLAKLDCHVCVQPEFLKRFGSTYRKKLGDKRASNLIRIRSLISAGLSVSFSSDRPITTGCPELGVQLATHRPDGFNPDENCTVVQALDAYTSKAAQATRDGEILGAIRNGSPAKMNWIPA